MLFAQYCPQSHQNQEPSTINSPSISVYNHLQKLPAIIKSILPNGKRALECGVEGELAEKRTEKNAFTYISLLIFSFWFYTTQVIWDCEDLETGELKGRHLVVK